MVADPIPIRKPLSGRQIVVLERRAAGEDVPRIAAALRTQPGEIRRSLHEALARLGTETEEDALARFAAGDRGTAIPGCSGQQVRLKMVQEASAVADVVGAQYNVSPAALRAAGRTVHVVRARQVAMYALVTCLGLTADEVGSVLGRDHSTVLHALTRVTAWVRAGDADVAGALESVQDALSHAHLETVAAAAVRGRRAQMPVCLRAKGRRGTPRPALPPPCPPPRYTGRERPGSEEWMAAILHRQAYRASIGLDRRERREAWA